MKVRCRVFLIDPGPRCSEIYCLVSFKNGEKKITFILTVLLLIHSFSYYVLPVRCRKEVLVFKGGKPYCFPYFRLPECCLKENMILKGEVPLDPSSHGVSLNRECRFSDRHSRKRFLCCHLTTVLPEWGPKTPK